MTKPLVGVRILDLTHMLSGPYGAMLLADLGAETIKVEPLQGEGTRKLLATDPNNSIDGMGAYFITTPMEFYIAAAMVGMVMGGIQALSRSTFSKMIPETDNTTSYFSFYDVSQKVSVVFGMTLFAFVDQITGSMRNSILVFIFIFLLGAILLKRIKIKNY